MTDLAQSWTQRMNNAVDRLAETDELEAQLKARVERQKKLMDAKFTTIAAHAEGTVLQREAVAYEHADYESAEAAYLLALREHGALKNERATHSLIVEVWRSLNSARTKGNIV